MFEDNNNYEELNTKDTEETDNIFKLSEEELYDDVKPEKKKTKKSKVNPTAVILVIVTIIALVIAAVAFVWGAKTNKEYQSLKLNYDAQVAKNSDYENKVKSLETQISELQVELTKKTETGDNKSSSEYPKGTKLMITEDGSTQGVRSKASVDSDVVQVDEHDLALYWGDEITLTADATIGSDGTVWGKYEKGYIRIKVDGEVWAEVVE